MAEVNLSIGGHLYAIACREGEEAHLLNMGAIIDAKALEAREAVGGLNEVRQLLFAALLLADELNDVRRAPHTTIPEVANLDQRLAAVAAHLEDLATGLENSPA